jgi:hypothetical protein
MNDLNKSREKVKYGELNIFLKYALWIGVIIGIISHYGNNTEYISNHREYLYLFMTVNFILGAISIIGCMIILRMKNFIGYLVIVFNALLACVLSVILNYLLQQYNVFNIADTIIRNVTSVCVISLLLLLKKNGKSAYSLLKENYKIQNKKYVISEGLFASRYIVLVFLLTYFMSTWK